MTIPVDPEIAAVLMERVEQAVAAAEVVQRGDALALRDVVNATIPLMLASLPYAPEVSVQSFTAEANDGASLQLRWYKSSALSHEGPAVVYVHGGGMIAGTLDNVEALVRHYVQTSGVPFLAVEYRLAPEHPGETPARDVLACLKWLVTHADRLRVNTARVALMGESGGGGVAAGAAILARDHGIQLAKQVLIYPMLDDRNTEPDPLLAPTATWTYDNNYTGWHAMLGAQLGQPTVSPIAAAARLTDFSGLAPAFIEVGDLDIFRDECIAYAHRLVRAGVSCDLRVYAGAPHAFEFLNPESNLSKRSFTERMRILASL